MPERAIEPWRVVVAGGGVAGLEACLALADLGERRLRVTLVAPAERFTLAPLAVAVPFGGDPPPSFALADVVAGLGARHIRDHMVAVRPGDMAIELEQGGDLQFDALLVATGARHRTLHPDVLTFGGPTSAAELGAVVDDLADGRIETVAFVVPAGSTWPLPAYELALMTRRWAGRGRVLLVTPERAPLLLFGEGPSRIVAGLLEEAGIEVCTEAEPAVGDDARTLFAGADGPVFQADRIVALPVPLGPEVPGLPHDEAGYVPVDAHGRVRGLRRIYAAGDITDQPVKQGGLAAQQAYAAVRHITASAGGMLGPEPFRPVLRGLLLTGERERYLRHGPDGIDRASPEFLWWPPAKVVGRYLAPWIAHRLHDQRLASAPAGGTPVERELPASRDPAVLGLEPYGP